VVRPDQQHGEGQRQAENWEKDEGQLLHREDGVRVQVVVLGIGHHLEIIEE